MEAAAWLGEVDENHQPHKIMVPFVFEGEYTVKSIVPAGEYKIDDTIAVLTDAEGNDHEVTMAQKWPVKKAILAYKSKPRPFKLLETGVRTIDTANPICEGGTGFIPGPFGTGKTVRMVHTRNARRRMVTTGYPAPTARIKASLKES